MRGSCLCGAVAFEATDPIGFWNCHCSRCRKARGAAYAANIFVRPATFRWMRGEDHLTTYRLPSAQRFASTFCRTCGSPMPRVISGRDFVLVPAGSLDDDPGIRAQCHIFVGSKAPWHDIFDHLPQFPEYAPPKA